MSDQGKLELIVLLIAYKAVYLGCQLDSKFGGEVLASSILRILNAKRQFLERKSRYLTPAFKRLLCNALLQPNSDYECSSLFPLLKESLKNQTAKGSKQIHSFLTKLPTISCIESLHFRKIKWRPSRDRVKHCIVNIVFKY